MARSSPSGIACFFATAPEAHWLGGKLHSHARVWLKPSLFQWGVPALSTDLTGDPRPLLIVESGIGPIASGRAAQYAFSHFPIGEAWIFGLAGATQRGLKPGEALLASTIVEEGSDSAGESWEANPQGLEQAQRLLEALSMPVQVGPLLSINRIAYTPEEKIHLGEKYGCLGLEMEAAPIAREAKRRGIPLTHLRWVSDGAEETFPEIDSFIDERGRTRPFASLFGLLRRPRLFLEIPPFLWKVRSAMAAQNRFLQKWLEDGRMAASPKV